MNLTLDQFLQKHINDYWDQKYCQFLTIDELERFLNPAIYDDWKIPETHIITIAQLEDATEELAIQTLIHKDDHLYPTQTLPNYQQQEDLSDIEIITPSVEIQNATKGYRRKKKQSYQQKSIP